MGGTEWALLIALSMLWGGSFFFGEIALREFPPFVIVLCRVSIAAVVLNALVRLRGYRMPSTLRGWTPFVAMGLLNNLLPFSLIFWGQTQIASGLAAILNATTPIFTILLAHLLTVDERLTPQRASGVAVSLLGVAVLIGPAAFEGIGANVVAQLAVLGAACSYALAGIFGRRFKSTPALVTAAGQTTASSVFMFPIVMAFNAPWQIGAPNPSTIAALICLGLFSTAVAYVIYFRVLAVAGATNLLLVTFLIPVSAITLGVLVLGEAFTLNQLLGMIAIGCGLLVIDGRLLRTLRGAQLHDSPSATKSEQVTG